MMRWDEEEDNADGDEVGDTDDDGKVSADDDDDCEVAGGDDDDGKVAGDDILSGNSSKSIGNHLCCVSFN